MTKLEEKLIELSYVNKHYNAYLGEYEYLKTIPDVAELHIYYSPINKTYYGMCITTRKVISQNVIDNLQQAFNQLQNDLEVLNDEC